MRTEELIRLLSADTNRISKRALEARLGVAALLGGATALALVILWLGVRPDLSAALGRSFFWIKASYTAALAVAFLWTTTRMARPGVSGGIAWVLGAGIAAAFFVAAMLQFAPMSGREQVVALQGVSWRVCTRNIALLALPLLLLTLWVLRSFAPTRPAFAGLGAGLFAGGLAATIYGLHCPEATFVFVGVWYTLGVLVSGMIGALLGSKLLRW